MLALDEELVETVEDEIDEVSKAAGVSSNGNVLGDDEVDEDADEEVSVDESEVDDREDLEDNVDAADETADEYFDEKDFFDLPSLDFLSDFLLINDNWFGRM